jgi:hypothetical protein
MEGIGPGMKNIFEKHKALRPHFDALDKPVVSTTFLTWLMAD